MKISNKQQKELDFIKKFQPKNYSGHGIYDNFDTYELGNFTGEESYLMKTCQGKTVNVNNYEEWKKLNILLQSKRRWDIMKKLWKQDIRNGILCKQELVKDGLIFNN